MSRRAAHTLLVAAAIAAGGALIGPRCADPSDEGPTWARDLPGHIVFADQEGDVSVIYRVAANGGGRVRLYRNDDPLDPDALYPSWVDAGRRVRFTAMRAGAWAAFEIDAGGGGPAVAAGGDFRLLSVPGESPDLEVEGGALYARDPSGARHLVHREPSGPAPVSLANASWGPGRDFVLFQACRGPARCELRVARADGGGTFTVGSGRHPHWTWPGAPAR